MKKWNKFWLLTALLAVGVSTQAKVMESSVATVNGRPILNSEYDNYLNGVVAQYKAAAPQFLKQPYAEDILGREVLKELISKELLQQAAEAAKIQVKDSEVDSGINEIKTRFIIDEATGKEDPKGADKRFTQALKKENMTLKGYKDKIKKDVAVRKMMEQHIAASIKPVEEADVKALYADVDAVRKNNTKRIKEIEKEDPMKLKEVQAIAGKLHQLTGEQVRLGHIFLATPKDLKAEEVKQKQQQAWEIKKEIDGGMDFSAAVKKYTEDKEALASGGDMILVKGIAPKEIDEKAFSLAVGKVSEPIKSDLGYHILKVKEKRAEKTIAYEDVSKDMAQYLAQQRIQAAMAKHVSDLFNKADVKVTKTFESDKLIEEALAKQAAEKASKEAKPANATEEVKTAETTNAKK